MSENHEKFEGLVTGNGDPHWGQSYYYNCYDPASSIGVLVRAGFLENRREANSWLIVFRHGLPIFTRTNQNLPYTDARPFGGVDIAGMRIEAVVPLEKTRITLHGDDFSLDLVWDEWQPLADCIAMSQDKDGAFAREIAHVHLEGTCRISGNITVRGEHIAVQGSGFRDIAAGPRNWDALQHYRLAWPVFEDGRAFAGVHGISTDGRSAYMRMFNDGKRWCHADNIRDSHEWAPDGLSVTQAHWQFTDESGKAQSLSGEPLFRWLFPLDGFVLCEQIMKFRLGDGTIGYGLYETGYRLPWRGIKT